MRKEPGRAGFRGVFSAILSLGCVGACNPPTSLANHAATQPSIRGATDWVLMPMVSKDEQARCPLRIVSAAPVVTEICFALGVGDAVVGRTRYCTYPPAAEAIPSIGSLTDANIELLLSLHPDLILISGTSQDMTDRFRAAELRFESIPDETLDDIFAGIRRVGELVGRPRTAELLASSIQRELEEAARESPTRRPQRVLLLTGTLSDPPQPPFVAGPGSFYDDLIRMAGHENVVKERSAFGPLSFEAILEADPDVIVELDPDGAARPEGDKSARHAWREFDALRAVRSGRVRELRGPEHFLPGPRIVFVARALWRAIAQETP